MSDERAIRGLIETWTAAHPHAAGATSTPYPVGGHATLTLTGTRTRPTSWPRAR